MSKQKFPTGWDEARIKRLADHYENMDDDELLAEDEGVRESERQTCQHSAWRSTPALVSLVLCDLSWILSAAMFGGRRLFGPGWFGQDREWVALGVSVALSIFHWFWGRRLLRQNYDLRDT